MKKVNILFVHPLTGNAYELYKAFDRNSKVNIIPLLGSTIKSKNSLLKKIRFKLKLQQDIYEINKKLLSYDMSKIDIIFVVKGNEISPSTLKKIKNKYPAITLINWSLDDMSGWHTKSIFSHFSLKLFDIVYTTKTYNLSQLKGMGIKNVKYLNQAYSEDIHKEPKYCESHFSHEVLFIGRAEKERFQSMEFLAKNNIVVNIYGTGWHKKAYQNHHKNLIIHDTPLYNQDYSNTIGCSKINLAFLSKINCDLHTSRSVEIPACGGFMLAERTTEHCELFTEDKEAIYFSSDEELLEKVHYYLKHNEERKAIAEAGLKRCLTSGYSYDDMIDKILKNLDE